MLPLGVFASRAVDEPPMTCPLTNRTHLTILLIAALASIAAVDQPPRSDPNLWIGMKAPQFRLRATDEANHSVDSLIASGPAVIVWFPKAYTGNVDRMLKSLDDSAKDLNSHGVRIVVASCDKTKYLTPYARSLNLGVPILADPTRTTAIRWGVLGPGREIPRRWAYFVDREGRIASIRTDLDAASAGAKIIERARELGWIR